MNDENDPDITDFTIDGFTPDQIRVAFEGYGEMVKALAQTANDFAAANKGNAERLHKSTDELMKKFMLEISTIGGPDNEPPSALN